MFFIGIFGIDRKTEKVNELPDTECRECRRKGGCILLKEYSRFHFFFFPLFTWGASFRVVCGNCGTAFSAEEGKECCGPESNEGSEASFMGGLTGRKQYCPECGRQISGGFYYCPGCGFHLKNR